MLAVVLFVRGWFHSERIAQQVARQVTGGLGIHLLVCDSRREEMEDWQQSRRLGVSEVSPRIKDTFLFKLKVFRIK
jgi:hypothetical protein